MRLLTWNVNGLRAIMKKGFEDIIVSLDPDFVCLQEIKAMPEQVEIDPDLYPYMYINPAKRKGYSGTLILTRFEPLNVCYGVGVEELDQEGRTIALEYEDFVVITVYTPNAQDNLKRIDFRLAWDAAFAKFVSSFAKPVMVCGDFNVAETDKDVFDAIANEGKTGFSKEERESFAKHLRSQLDDAFRIVHPDEIKYSWWSYYSRGREKGEGWRIDYWLVSPQLDEKINDVIIYDDIYGSDHCPVELDIDLKDPA